MNYLKFCSIALALLLLGTGSADAQQCFTQVSGANMVRAEGLTEVVGGVRVLCRHTPAGTATSPFGGGLAPMKFTLAVELNTRITNTITNARQVKMRTMSDSAATPAVVANYYTDGGIALMAKQNSATGTEVTDSPTAIPAANFGAGTLSNDGTKISWTLYSRDDPATADVDEGTTRDINLTADTEGGFTLNIQGIRANAAMLGNGEDVMANILVNGTAVNAAALKLADVSDGIMLDIGKVTGLQCKAGVMGAAGMAQTARVTIKEGFASAWMGMPSMEDDTGTTENEAMMAYADTFVVTVSNVPEGVKVSVPTAIELEMDTTANMNGSVALDLDTCRTCGADSKGNVSLSPSRAGMFRYKIRTIEFDDNGTAGDTTDDTAASSTVQDDLAEWVHVPITFTWSAGGADLGAVDVNVGFYPMSDHSGDSFDTNGAAMPRFSEDGTDAMGVLTIKDCMTTLFYPFVTSASGYDTGIVVSNTSGGAGGCSASFSGMEDSVDLGEIMAGTQSVFLVSSHMEDFSGYLEVVCDTESASGFAHVVDTSGLAGSQGYIAQCDGEGCK